ncbi:MAG: CHASE domain-containing protein [Telluria sp.]
MRKSLRAMLTLTEPAMWAGLVLSAGVGLLFYLATERSIETDASARFDNLARLAQTSIDARLRNYTDVLRGSASLFQSSDLITRAQFHDYVAGLHLADHFPGIESINFAYYIVDEDLPVATEHIEAELARENPAGPRARLKVTPPGKRADYSLLLYIEPSERWAARFGFDLQARAAVKEALMRSRDTGEVSSSGVPLPMMKGPNRTGMGMRLPVYRRGMPVGTVAERRAAYLGSVGLGFSVQHLVQGVLDDMRLGPVRLAITDESHQALLFDSAATEHAPHPPQATVDGKTFISTQPIDFNGHIWHARFSMPKAALYTNFDQWFPWMASGAGWLVTLLLYALFHTLATSRQNALRLAGEMTRELRESQDRLLESHEHLRRLAAHADQIKEEERKRIAREIHDDLGQNLLALRIEADLLASRTAQRHPRLHERARATLAQIDATIRSVRQIINDLRPNVLDLGLNAAVDWLVSDFRRRTGVQCELIETDTDIVLDDAQATAFFRILQESLNNITRHAQATYVRVDLSLRDGVLAMNVADNGNGMARAPGAKPDSFGLIGIEERVRILGGKFAIHSAPGRGTTVSVAVRIAPAAHQNSHLEQDAALAI